MQSPVPPTEELILERLLAGLLERGGPDTDGMAVPPDVVELRDMARRLRASVQWMPLPRSRLALRRALLATVEAAHSRPAAPQRDRYRPAAWRRTGRWLTAMTAATFLMIGAALGAHALGLALSPSGPLYAIALQIDAMRVDLAGDAVHRAAMLLDVTRARAAEIGAMAYDDDPRGVAEAASALERQNRWLRSVAKSLPTTDQKRFAPAAAKSDTLVTAARRAAQLRMGGLLPSGVTMVDLLNASSGPLSGAATTEVSAPSGASREGVHDAISVTPGVDRGPSRADSRTTLQDGATAGATSGHSGASHTSGATGGNGAPALDGAGRGGATPGGGANGAADSHKSGGDADRAPASGSGANGAGDRHGDAAGGGHGGGGPSGGGQGGGGPSGGGHGAGDNHGGGDSQGGGAQGSGGHGNEQGH
jgi:hypothetical protein